MFNNKKVWNPFRLPVKKEIFDAWTKTLDDCAKVAIVGIPVVMFGDSTADLFVKVVRTLSLIAFSYGALVVTRQLRENAENFIEQEPQKREEK